MSYWLLRIKWVGYEKHLMLAFRSPPSRQDVKPIIEAQWKAEDDGSDQAWEFLLIADCIPEHPFEGEVSCLYGTITCQERYMHDNGPHSMER